MKKYLLTWALITITATTLYATTAGSTVVDAMKAASHAFTLATNLNPGQTGLTSEPVKGKKTGDILTAGEYNRILELVSEGGGGVSGSGWVDVPLTDTTPFDKTCEYRFTVNTNGDYVWIAGTNPVFYASAIDPFAITYIAHSSVITHILASSKNAYRINWTESHTVTKIEKLCGGGSSVSASSGWVDVPFTDTNPFDQQCMYRFVSQGQTYYAETVHEDRLYWINVMYFAKGNKSVLVGGIAPFDRATKMEKFCGGGSSTGLALYKCTNAQSLDPTNAPCYGASRNGGAGTNQYRVVSCSNTDASGTYTAGGLLNFGDFITNKWSFHINNSNIACTDGTILVMDIQGGGSGSASASCPSWFVAVGSFCIEPTMNATNKDWYEAALACTEKGAQLCHWSEWSAACQKGVLTDVVFGASGKYEWIDDYSIANQGIADPIVYSNCKYLSRQADGTKAANTAYRCCAPKQ